MATKKYKGNENFNIDWSTFRENLQGLLDSRGFTKADLARAVELSPSTIVRYFYETTPDMVALWIIADFFDVPIDWLIGRSKDRWSNITDDLKALCNRYTIASETDKAVVDTLLSKYA